MSLAGTSIGHVEVPRLRSIALAVLCCVTTLAMTHLVDTGRVGTSIDLNTTQLACPMTRPTYPLPDDRVEQIDATPPSMVVQMSLDGTVRVAGKTIRDDMVDNLFRATFQHDKTTQVVFKVDRRVAHRRIVNLMERAKAAGLMRFAVGTTRDGP
jgi:biopolymer transport protein ExbD